MLVRLVASKWAIQKGITPKVIEDDLTLDEIKEYNKKGYHVYNYPNRPKDVQAALELARSEKRGLNGGDINLFRYVYLDMDLKDGEYKTKDEFIELLQSELVPTSVVDSGHGIHAYWKVKGLEPMSFLLLQMRLARKFKSDDNLVQLKATLRLPNTLNIKDEEHPLECKVINSSGKVYTAAELDQWLPKISFEDEKVCTERYDIVYNSEEYHSKVKGSLSEELPKKFHQLLNQNDRVKTLYFGPVQDRSRADFELGHILYTSKFTESEATSVLCNVEKAKERTPKHRLNYAQNIIKKIWTSTEEEPKNISAKSVKDILGLSPDKAKENQRLYGHSMFDATRHGFRLTEVWGIIGGSGVGKSSVSMNQFKWFAQYNPELIHIFVSLEMPANEVAQRWLKMCGEDTTLFDKVYIIDNYDEEGLFKHLSLEDIKNEVLGLEKETNKKVGCVVVDHIGVLKATPKNTGEYGGIQAVCEEMKPFAKTTNTFLIMQSQTSRAKAGIGDIELDKDAAYGTSLFENYCDYVTTIWQPLKRVYGEMSEDRKLTVIAFKFCKIRHKDVLKDKIQEDQVFAAYFDVKTETLRKLTSDEFEVYDFWNKQATTLRNKDRKTQPAQIKEMVWVEDAGKA